MWVCLNNAFLSIVSKECKSDELLVRARVSEHITNVFPDAKVKQTKGTDYAYRAVVKRSKVAMALTDMAYDLDYSNFKDSVHDHDLHIAYMGVWGVMGKLQPGGPYGRGLRRNDASSLF